MIWHWQITLTNHYCQVTTFLVVSVSEWFSVSCQKGVFLQLCWDNWTTFWLSPLKNIHWFDSPGETHLFLHYDNSGVSHGTQIFLKMSIILQEINFLNPLPHHVRQVHDAAGARDSFDCIGLTPTISIMNAEMSNKSHLNFKVQNTIIVSQI